MCALICNTFCLSVSTNSKPGFISDHMAAACFVAFVSNSLSVPCTLGCMAYPMVWGEMLRKWAAGVSINANATATTVNPIKIAKHFRFNDMLLRMQLPFFKTNSVCVVEHRRFCNKPTLPWVPKYRVPAAVSV